MTTIAIVGPPGTGKTNLAVRLMQDGWKSGFDIAANFPARSLQKFEVVDINGVIEPASRYKKSNLNLKSFIGYLRSKQYSYKIVQEKAGGIWIFIDEAWKTSPEAKGFDSRNWGKFTDDDHEFFSLARQRKNRIYVLAQSIDDLDAIIRRNLKGFYVCRGYCRIIPHKGHTELTPLYFKYSYFSNKPAGVNLRKPDFVKTTFFSFPLAACYKDDWFGKSAKKIHIPDWDISMLGDFIPIRNRIKKSLHVVSYVFLIIIQFWLQLFYSWILRLINFYTLRHWRRLTLKDRVSRVTWFVIANLLSYFVAVKYYNLI